MRTSGRLGFETIALCTLLALCGVVLAGCGRPTSAASSRPITSVAVSKTMPSADSGRTVPLPAVVRSWPTSWAVTGTHSEATYVEHVTISRREDDFTLRIVITAQGSQGGGSWQRSVRIEPSGRIDDLDPNACGGDCAALNGERGYLAAATLVSLQRIGKVPAIGTERAFGGREVICVNGDQLYDASGMGPTDDSLRLDPCFDSASGAVVAQYSPALGTFGGPTLDTDTLRISAPTAATA